MRTISITIIAVLLMTLATPLWAASSRTIAVSCEVQPRLSVQLEQNQGVSTEIARGSLLQQKELRTHDLPPRYGGVIIHSYSER